MRVIDKNGKEIPGSSNTAADNEAPYKEAKQEVANQNGPDTMTGTEEAIRKARRKCTISDNMVKLLCTQIKADFSNYIFFNIFEIIFIKKDLNKIS